MAADSGIDPRYAAQFQRGFDPAQHAAEAPPERRGPRWIEGGPPPVVQRVPDPPRIAERPAVGPVVAERLAVRREEDEPLDAADEPAPRRPRAEWALLAAGVAFLIGAAVLFRAAVDIARRVQGVTPSFDEQLGVLTASALPGPLVVAGAVAICLWIVLRALHPRKATP